MNVTKQGASVFELPKSLTITSEDEMTYIASLMAKSCHKGDCILLKGEVGAGKTTFARAFIRSISPVQDDIVSPTFTLVQTYPLHNEETLWHYDLYRLNHVEELEELGLDDAFDSGITLIEWPEIAQAWIPETALSIELFHGKSDNERVLHIASRESDWSDRLQPIMESL